MTTTRVHRAVRRPVRRRPRWVNTRYRGRYWDPTGKRYGIPTYPWECAPHGLVTLRQLTALGLRPNGQPVAAQIMWRRYHTDAIAYLYRLELAAPKRPMTPAKTAALAKANQARRTCPTCTRDVGYTIPTRYGQCLDCHDRIRTRSSAPSPSLSGPLAVAA